MTQALKIGSRAPALVKYLTEVSAEVISPKPKKVAMKTLADMPGPSACTFLYDLFCRGGLSRLHELQMEGRAKYGPMWKASFGPILTVHVAEPNLIEQVLRQEGKHPIRSDLSSWKDYRQCRGHAYGLLTAEGEEWQSVRSILGKHMLRPKEVEAYADLLNDVVTDCIKKINYQRSKNSNMVVKDIADEFYKFGLEAKVHIDKRMAETAEKMARGEMIEGKYLTYFLARENLSMKMIYGNVTELLLAGVDTISSTMSWALHELAQHPEIQTALYQEITSVIKDGEIPSAADVAKMPLMKAVVKEVLRLYPVIPGNARVISDRDIEVGGYIIPKKTLITLCHYATSRDEKNFLHPHRFQPERWLTKEGSHHPYASIPFGFGKRSCIGRRLAELEIYLAIARILMHFEVKPELMDSVVKPMTRTLLVPEKEISLQFVDR